MIWKQNIEAETEIGMLIQLCITSVPVQLHSQQIYESTRSCLPWKVLCRVVCIHCGIKDSNQATNKQWCARTPILVKFVSMIAVFLHQSPLTPNEKKYWSISFFFKCMRNYFHIFTWHHPQRWIKGHTWLFKQCKSSKLKLNWKEKRAVSHWFLKMPFKNNDSDSFCTFFLCFCLRE